MAAEPLGQAFFARDVVDVARDLIGRTLRRDSVVLRITETEAYKWPPDTACHAKAGRTARTAPLFGPPGHAYVYLCYGIHNLLNLVTGEDGQAQAVLIRACAPLEGLGVLTERRGGRGGPSLLDGPGKVGQALGLDTTWSHHDVTTASGLEVGPGTLPAGLLAGPRIGIDYALPEHRALPWRFAEADSRWVSHRKTLRPVGAAVTMPP
ncbi:MAG: DNA-3-methyladenine glycosylase [Nannocystaceae bacterium]|nr:DNA-3-methyladenine glycosylase [Nannocystaceae bacterium]